jgi:Ca2+-binding RTX toxin-like protein
MSVVTVQGASGSIFVPFKSSAAAGTAQQIANAISAAIKAGTLYAAPTNPKAKDLLALPTVAGGATAGEYVFKDGGSKIVPANYDAIINDSTKAATINAQGGTAPFSVIGGTGGTTFYTQSSTGGFIGLGGGANTIAGSSKTALAGNWTIDVGNGDTSKGGSTSLNLAGNDTIEFGGNVSGTLGGGGNYVLIDSNTDTVDPLFILGSGSAATLAGGSGGGILFFGGLDTNATVGSLLVGGTAGSDTIVGPSGTGINTLVGAGNGDVLFASGSGANVLFGGQGNETLQGSGASGAETIYGGVSSLAASAAGAPNDVLSGSSSSSVIEAGSGNDTIWTGLGTDTVWFVASQTGGKGGVDIIEDFNTSKDQFFYQGYSGSITVSTVSSGSFAGDVQFKLSDGTTVTFNGVTNSSLIKVTQT